MGAYTLKFQGAGSRKQGAGTKNSQFLTLISIYSEIDGALRPEIRLFVSGPWPFKKYYILKY